MKIELEVSDDLVGQFGEEALKTFLNFKLENMQQKMLHLPDAIITGPEFTEDQNNKIKEAWEKVKKMGPSC